MGRMKELFMEMQEQELYDMSLHEYLSMKNNQAMMEEPHPDPESELGDEYWQAKADEQAMYEKHIEEEKQKGPTTVNNALFVGSTAELAKLLKQQTENENV